ncbi:hypothetical protein H5202_05060 [Shewanella sp. SG41-4]|uniref:hypothetical protein n=1 Tax=Shewanella sp. SG41-4 TaxID=2760976 RepID=UPI001603F7E7|nr:hypothetical protein [Shewanella sp. SG41-4]MBB1438061.1 hypothetical protein [Shewanella sp. SG41-4]
MKALLYCIVLVALTISQAHAKDTPNGKPFIALEEQIAATNAAIDATNEAVEATNGAVEATNEALDASNAATDASIQALNAADAALQARDDFLQSQIDLLNMTLSDQLVIINARFEELEDQIESVDAQSQAADALMAEKIELNRVAIDLLTGQVDSQEQLNAYQTNLINTLFSRVNSLDTSVASNQYVALQQYQTIANQIRSIQSEDSYTSSQISYLQSQLSVATSKINTLSNSLGRECIDGYYVAGVQTDGRLLCREASDIVVVTQPLTKTRTCVSEFIGCLDYEYWQYGTAYCPTGYKRTATSYSTPGGLASNQNYYSAAYVRTSRTDSESTATGYVKVTCSNDPLYEYTPY